MLKLILNQMINSKEIDKIVKNSDGSITILYTKEFTFNKINGLVKNHNRTAAEEADAQKIEFHIYDVFLPVGYETRDKIKNYFKHTNLVPLKTTYVEATNENLKALLEDALSRGEEGLIIRQLGIPYEHKRTWQLLKYKIFEDKEFVVVGFEESVKGGMVGAIICKMDVPAVDVNGKTIETFKAGLKFSHEEAREMWNNQSKYIGQELTVEFFGRSEYSVPRFPKGKAFRHADDK
jgi:hypothetical protein